MLQNLYFMRYLVLYISTLQQFSFPCNVHTCITFSTNPMFVIVFDTQLTLQKYITWIYSSVVIYSPILQ